MVVLEKSPELKIGRSPGKYGYILFSEGRKEEKPEGIGCNLIMWAGCKGGAREVENGSKKAVTIELATTGQLA